MPIKLIHVSDIHFGSGESHGRLNPQTGLNIRFEDFAAAFAKAVDYCLESQADVFLFSGDAYKNASPEPMYQQAFARQLKRLSSAKVPTILLVGNHDQILRSGPSHSMSVFQSLEVPGITVIETPQLRKIKTKHGQLQVLAMPHVTRHLLMTQDKYAHMSASEIDRVLADSVSSIFADFYEQLDPKIPALSTAHMMMDTARAGAEQELMVGYSMTFPLDILIDARIDYVALGHVHGHQILRREKPLIAYAGSIERVDFGEENEDKGFLEVDIERGNASLKFHSINPRPFITVDLDLTATENPSEVLFNAAQAKVREGAVLRLKYRIQQHRLGEIDEERVRAAMPHLLSLRFKPELVYTERPRRMPEINEQSVLQPLVALEKYLSDVAPENKAALLARARKLIDETERENC